MNSTSTDLSSQARRNTVGFARWNAGWEHRVINVDVMRTHANAYRRGNISLHGCTATRLVRCPSLFPLPAPSRYRPQLDRF